MKGAIILAGLCACASRPPPRPPPRLADAVEIIHVQIGWLQVTSGQPYKPPVEVLNGGPAPDERHAEEIARDVLDQCEKGAPMGPLQRRYSEADPGTMTVDEATRQPFRDVALGLHNGECFMMRSDYAFHVIKRVR
ncbi:MAG: hypothetical protein ABR567_06110 [Myxococcales bacterium]